MTTKEKIKKIALTHFAANGYEGATLTAIAAEVGIKTPSMYAFFENKEELFLEVFKETQKEYNQYVIRTVSSKSAGSVYDKLYGVLRSALMYNQENMNKVAFYKRVILFPPVGLEEKINIGITVTEEVLTTLLQTLFMEGMEQGVIRKVDIESLVDTFYCIMDGIFFENSLYEGEIIQRKLKNSWNTFWNGITYKNEK